MKTEYMFLIWVFLVSVLVAGCSKDSENDTEKPVINMDGTSAFPTPCDTLFRGQTSVFKAEFSDNIALGSFNLELHHNFDHHTHGSHNETCERDPVQDPVNPFYFNESFTIPNGLKSFSAETEIFIPSDSDPGDYHFMVKLTDKEGWQSWQSVSVKIK